VAPLFQEWLDTHYPLKASRVENAVRQMRGGKLYRSGWGQRMRGTGPMAELIDNRFSKALRSNGLNTSSRSPDLRCDLFRPPGHQESLF